MPGIVGLITKMPPRDAEAKVLRMVAAIRHEPSYVSGVWRDESLGVYAGWAERDTTATLSPIQDASSDLAILFSGETLAERGGASDERARLLQAAEYDSHFPKSLNGLFHGVMVDRKTNKVVLFIDRYGMHRLYYYEAEDAFYFAAEAKAIHAVCPQTRAIDPEGLAQFISCGCTLGNGTMFQDISVLPGGSAWVFNAGALSAKENYFHPSEWENQTALDLESYHQQLRAVFAERIPKYFQGVQQIGVSLTGGLDSRMLMSWSGAAPRTLRCYSFGGVYRDSQDVKIARNVALVCDQPHEVICAGPEFLQSFQHYAERTVFLTDGCVEVKHAPDLYVSECAARMSPVRVTGNYGGEVLRQVRAFRPMDPRPGVFAPELNGQLARVKEVFAGLLTAHPLTFAAFCQAPWRQYGLLSLERTQQQIRSPFLDNNIVQAVYRAPNSALLSDDTSLRLIAEGSRELRRIRTDRGVGGQLPAWLAALQQAWFEFTFKAEYAYDYGMPQSVVRVDHALKQLHLERLFLGRHKFTHFRVWYRDALSNYVRDTLLDPRALTRPYLERGAVERMVREHCAGRRNFTSEIHKLLTLEHIHRLFIDRP
jgi:asparagine synthase (glutamine-hydrolysing)